MELRHLRYFVAVAEELSFRRAAEQLQMAQPPLSRQIRDLELEIGVKLLERNQRNVLLTKAGKSFLQDVKILLQQVESAVTSAQKIHENLASELTIGFNRAASYRVLPQLLSAVAPSQLQIQLLEMDNAQLLTALHQKHIDVALGYSPLTSLQNEEQSAQMAPAKLLTGKVWAVLQSEELLLATPGDFQNTSTSARETGRPTSLEMSEVLQIINGSTLILPPQLWDRKDGESIEFLGFLASQGIKPNSILEVADRETALSFVSNNLGITIIPESMIHLKRAGISYQELPGNWEKLEIIALWRCGNQAVSLRELIIAMETVLFS